MQTAILNVGLDAAGTAIASAVALEVIKAEGFLVHRHAVHQSDTESTLVAEVSPDPLLQPRIGCFWRIARDLRQDCIAVWGTRTERGFLSGPRSTKWGTFNPAAFLLLDGSRLAVPVPAAA